MNTIYLKTLLLIIISISFFSCEEEESILEEDYQMCYKLTPEAGGGTRITINCREVGQCDSGFTALARYENFNECAGDADFVVDNFVSSGGNVLAGPNAIGGAGSSGGGDDDGGDGGSGTGCDDLAYNGPTEGQVMQWCQAAQIYECLNATDELNYLCDVIANYGASCPYCN